MTNEPVAYRVDGIIYNDINDAEFAVRETKHLRKSLGMDNGLIPKPICIEQLYTEDQLQHRVKMTQVEFDEFSKLSLSSAVTVYEAMDTVYKDKGEINDFSHLYQRLFNRNDKVELEKQIEFSNLWVNFNREKPEEMIEIIPTKKWFVRSTNCDEGRLYGWLIENAEDPVPEYLLSSNIPLLAIKFDTKEEAEEWTNPLTEAVLLPVERE